MLYSYNKYKLILESKKAEKQKEKIRKFLKFEPIIDYVFELLGDDNAQYAVWFANVTKNNFANYISDKNVGQFYIKDVEHYLRTGEIKKFASEEEYKNKYLEIENNTIEDWWESTFNDPYMSADENPDYWIRDWLVSPLRTEKLNLSQLTYDEAIDKSKEWHDELKASGIVTKEIGDIIMTFNDGYYWIDLLTNSCEEEGEAMGHCASTNSDTLLSLRHDKSPHVTIAFDFGDVYNSHSEMHQIKGRNNKKPKEKYHKYIIELICFPNVGDWVKIPENVDKDKYITSKIIHDQYNPEEDFKISDLTSEQIADILKRNKNFKLSFKDRYKLLKENYITKEEFASYYNDLILKNNEFYFILKSWNAIYSNIFNKTYGGYMAKQQGEEIYGILTGDKYYDINFHLEKLEYSYQIKINTQAREKIMKYLEENKIIIYYTINDEKVPHSVELNRKNMNIISGYIFFKLGYGDINISLYELLYSEKTKYNQYKISLSTINLAEMVQFFDNAYNMALRKNYLKKYKESIYDSIKETIGPFEIIDNKIHFKLNLDYMFKLLDISENNIIDLINEGMNARTKIYVDAPIWSDDIITPKEFNEELIKEIDKIK